MEHLRRLFIIFALSVALLATGTAGYVGIEGWHIKDAIYMTVITLATVGYSEVHPLSDPGRIFTMVLLLLVRDLRFMSSAILSGPWLREEY